MNDQTNGQLFVYGSLRSGFQSTAYEYISRYFTLQGTAKAEGMLYEMGDYPVAVPVAGAHFIIGELYKINHPEELSWALAQLDDYEGVKTEAGEAGAYKREETTVYADGKTTTAWTYWYAGDVTGKPVIESGDILVYMQQKNKI